MESIEINCKAADILPIDRILEFQGKLKKLSKKNKEKLKASILKHGFIAPLFVWDNAGDYSLLDGHQRLATLISMRQEGYDIPLLPVVYVEASNEADAKAKLLQITSQYGEFSLDGIMDFTDGLDFDFEEIRLTDGDFNIGCYDVEGIDAPELKDGDREPFQQMTFTMSDMQAETVKKAIDRAKSDGGGVSDENSNSNGNALAWVAGAYLGGC